MGFDILSIGVESGSERLINTVINKKLKLEDVIRATTILKKYNIGVQHYMTVGYPDEKWENIKESINFELKCRPDIMTVAMVVPYPGTPLSKNKKIGIREGVAYKDYFNEPMWNDRNKDVENLENISPHICYTNVMKSHEISQARYLMLKIWENRDISNRRECYMNILNSKITNAS